MNLRHCVGSVALTAALVLAACGSQPPVPDWKRQAQAASEQATRAYLAGRDGVAASELALAREEASSTGAARWLAQVELTHCALQVASLDPQPCSAFAPLAPDALPGQQAYARYLGGERLTPAEVALLPAVHQPMAQAADAAAALQVLPPEAEPLARLVAAGVALRTGRAQPALAQAAIGVAEAQGWRRPLLAWLGWLRDAHRRAGDTAQAAQLQRRMDWITQRGQPPLPGP